MKQQDDEPHSEQRPSSIPANYQPVQKPKLTLHQAGEKYDMKFPGPAQRHLHVRCAYGVYEAAWEGAPLDRHRVHALNREKDEAEKQLRAALLKRLGLKD